MRKTASRGRRGRVGIRRVAGGRGVGGVRLVPVEVPHQLLCGVERYSVRPCPGWEAKVNSAVCMAVDKYVVDGGSTLNNE